MTSSILQCISRQRLPLYGAPTTLLVESPTHRHSVKFISIDIASTLAPRCLLRYILPARIHLKNTINLGGSLPPSQHTNFTRRHLTPPLKRCRLAASGEQEVGRARTRASSWLDALKQSRANGWRRKGVSHGTRGRFKRIYSSVRPAIA